MKNEMTIRAVIIGILLSALLAAANAYLGLKAGMTVSASIPAAVLSFAILRWFRHAHILENNLVQTAASAGESLAAGMIFTLPALILLGVWRQFHYLEATVLILIGGLLGVLFAVPLRRALVLNSELRYPEGVATAEVLKAGYGEGGTVRALLAGAGVAALLKLLQSGFHLVAGTVAVAWHGGRGVFAFGLDISAALLAVGYIVRLNVAWLMFAGGAMVWLVAIPLYASWYGMPAGDGKTLSGMDAAFSLWSAKLRYLGVGAMLAGGLWTLWASLAPVWRALHEALFSSQAAQSGKYQDISMRAVVLGALLLAVPLFFVFSRLITQEIFDGNSSYILSLVMAVLFALGAGFLFSTVAAYMAGLVGSSNNPISGVTIATIFLSAWLLYWFLGGAAYFDADETRRVTAAAVTIIIGAVVCCAAAIAGDTLQDFKAGQIVGATPRRQQWIQIAGVVAAAVVLVPVLQLLYEAYGIAGHFPRAGMDPRQALSAPQATLMQSVAFGVFNRKLPWELIAVGALIALVIIVIDEVVRRRAGKFRVPVLAVAVGMYLPVTLSVPILLGGLVAARHKASSQGAGGVLFASGLIAGEALIGIVLALVFVLSQSTRVLSLVAVNDSWWQQLGGVGCLLLAAYLMHRVASQKS